MSTKVLNEIFWRLCSGSPWAKVPERLGPPNTCHNRFVRWRNLEVWNRIFDAITAAYDYDLRMIDRSLIRVHHNGASAKEGSEAPAQWSADGRRVALSQGGLKTEIHALVIANGVPVVLRLTPGQAHDTRSAASMLDGIGNGQILLADTADYSDAMCAELEARGARACVKPMANHKTIPAFSTFLYRYRNNVGCFFSKIKHFRAIATHHERHAENYPVLVKLTATIIGLRS